MTVNASTVRLVVLGLVLVLLVLVVFVGLLALQGRDTPDLLKSLAVGDLTGLLGLLVHPGAPEPPA